MATARTDNPLVVQSDHTLLLEVDHALAEAARQAVLPFTDLLKAPEHVHTYRITPFSLWNASASGMTATDVLSRLERFSRYPLPHNLILEIETQMGRFGKVELIPGANRSEILLTVGDDGSTSSRTRRFRSSSWNRMGITCAGASRRPAAAKSRSR
jgi:DNA excision repair protein ERCC-3